MSLGVDILRVNQKTFHAKSITVYYFEVIVTKVIIKLHLTNLSELFKET